MARINLNMAEIEALWVDKHSRQARVLRKAAEKRAKVEHRLAQIRHKRFLDLTDAEWETIGR